MRIFVFLKPENQTKKNYYAYKEYENAKRLGESKMEHYFHMDIADFRRYARVFHLVRCRYYFPSCDRTQSQCVSGAKGLS